MFNNNNANIPGIYQNQLGVQTKFNLKEFIANKATLLLWGNGDLFSSKDQKLKDEFETFRKNVYWEQLRAEVERLCSSIGKVYVTIDLDDGNNIRLSIAEPSFYSQMGRIYQTAVSAVVYKRITHDNFNFIIREVWDTEKVIRQYFGGKDNNGNKLASLSIMEINTKLPEELQVKEVWYHDAGFLPVVEFINKPIQPVYGAYNNYYYPDDYLCYGLQQELDDLFCVLKKETQFNRTRIIGDLQPADMLNIKNDPTNELRNTINDFWLSTSSLRQAGNSGIRSALEVLQGDPKFASYADQIQFIIDKYTEGCGYSPLMTSIAQKTEAETLFTKSLDNETTTYKREIRAQQWYRVFDRMLSLKGLMDYNKPREYEYSINSNLSIDKLKEAETIAFKVEHNLMSTAEGIAELRNIDIEEAKEISQEIFKENTERSSVEMGLQSPFNEPSNDKEVDLNKINKDL